MTPYERFFARLKGDPVDRPPNFDIIMQFGAHYIGANLSDYYLTHNVLVEANLAMVQNFEIDIVQAISDPYREAADLGLQVEFPEDSLPVSKIPLIQNPEDLGKLKRIKPEDGRRMSDRLEAIRLFREKVGGEIPIMGWIEGAMAEAADIRGVNNLMMDLFERPEWMKELLEFCVEMEIEFAKAQVEAGADIIGLGDAIASQVAPAQYAEYALPYEQRIFKAVKDLGATPRLHICGNTTPILELMKQSGADIVDLDWMVDFGEATKVYAEGPALCGNYDPVAVMLQGRPEDVQKAVTKNMTEGDHRCFSMAGCEIPDGTPEDNLKAHAETLKNLS